LKDCWVEIDIIGIRRGQGVSKEEVRTAEAPLALGHAPQAVKAGPLLFLSTGLPLNQNGRLVASPDQMLPYTSGVVAAQTQQILENAAAICAAAGGDLADIVRSHVYFHDLRDFPLAMQPWKAAFGSAPPATTFLEVPPIGLVPGGRISMDLWAYIP
jgi:enamine deaminase RidA (YjgF/YER057c/UK114 family)